MRYPKNSIFIDSLAGGNRYPVLVPAKTQNMETLIEKLYNNNVIFSYYGFVDHSVLQEVLRITKSKLEIQHESPVVISRVQDVLHNCVENIISHNFYPEDERVHYKSLLVVSRQGGDYEVDTLNVVNETQRNRIESQLKILASKTREQFLEMKTQSQLTGYHEVNQHLLSLFLRADHHECGFKPLDNYFLFNIGLRISTVGETVPA